MHAFINWNFKEISLQETELLSGKTTIVVCVLLFLCSIRQKRSSFPSHLKLLQLHIHFNSKNYMFTSYSGGSTIRPFLFIKMFAIGWNKQIPHSLYVFARSHTPHHDAVWCLSAWGGLWYKYAIHEWFRRVILVLFVKGNSFIGFAKTQEEQQALYWVSHKFITDDDKHIYRLEVGILDVAQYIISFNCRCVLVWFKKFDSLKRPSHWDRISRFHWTRFNAFLVSKGNWVISCLLLQIYERRCIFFYK